MGDDLIELADKLLRASDGGFDVPDGWSIPRGHPVADMFERLTMMRDGHTELLKAAGKPAGSARAKAVEAMMSDAFARIMDMQFGLEQASAKLRELVECGRL